AVARRSPRAQPVLRQPPAGDGALLRLRSARSRRTLHGLRDAAARLPRLSLVRRRGPPHAPRRREVRLRARPGDGAAGAPRRSLKKGLGSGGWPEAERLGNTARGARRSRGARRCGGSPSVGALGPPPIATGADA